jgi:hypothetical protein
VKDRRSGEYRGDDSDAAPRNAPVPGKRTLAEQLMRRPAGPGAPPTIHDVATAAVETRGAGEPVPDGVRRTAESHLAADLRDVRVHGDDDARASAAAMGAQAFTYGKDVFLGPGQRADDVSLMTHELTHVVQQGAAGPAVQRRVEVSPSDHPAEAEADAVAARAVQGERPAGAIVDDGAEVQPGQMTRAAVLAAIEQAASAEIAAAPPAVAPGLEAELTSQMASLRGRDARSLEQSLAAMTGVPAGRDAQVYVAAARDKVRQQVAEVSGGAATAEPTTAAEAVAQMGPSESLDGAAARAAGAGLGVPVGDVQVHTGPEAARFAAAQDARAVAVGDHIAFGAGEYRPGTPEGDALLAHEVAHTVQMKGGDPAAPLARGESEAAEVDADQRAEQILAAQYGGGAPDGRGAASFFGGEMQLRRCPDSDKQKLDAKAKALATELQTVIDGAVWKEIRKRVYPKESAANIQKAKDRKAGKAPDLTGLGKISTLEHFAGAIRGLQKAWPASVDDRLKAIAKAINAEMTSADVPTFLEVRKQSMEGKGSFSPGAWRFTVSEELVSGAALGDADAAELCNVSLHEARHAEQHFLAARFAAGPPKSMDAPAIAVEQGIPEDPIAKAAVAKKFDGKTDATVAGLGASMYQSMVTDSATNQRITHDDYTAEMKVARDEAIKSLAALKAAATATTIADATAKRDTLKAAIAEVEKRYTDYRNIPHEADAHDVGDAAELAFKGWP